MRSGVPTFYLRLSLRGAGASGVLWMSAWSSLPPTSFRRHRLLIGPDGRSPMCFSVRVRRRPLQRVGLPWVVYSLMPLVSGCLDLGSGAGGSLGSSAAKLVSLRHDGPKVGRRRPHLTRAPPFETGTSPLIMPLAAYRRLRPVHSAEEVVSKRQRTRRASHTSSPPRFVAHSRATWLSGSGAATALDSLVPFRLSTGDV